MICGPLVLGNRVEGSSTNRTRVSSFSRPTLVSIRDMPCPSLEPNTFQNDQTSAAYRVRTFTGIFGQQSVVLQDENGPCPLLAIVNALLLRGNVDAFHPDEAFVSFDKLRLLLTNYLQTTHACLLESELDLNAQQNVLEAISWLPRLQQGMDVNVGFRDCDDYELTANTVVFDAFRLRLLHGWLVDPEEVDLWSILSHKRYNTAVETLIMASTAPVGDTTTPCDPAIAIRLQEAALVQAFFDRSPSQLTYRGLVRLHEVLKEGEFAILFRNNHFSTMTKHAGAIFSLVTDAGMAREKRIVWEKLMEIEGDCIFVDGYFQTWNHSLMKDTGFPTVVNPTDGTMYLDSASLRECQCDANRPRSTAPASQDERASALITGATRSSPSNTKPKGRQKTSFQSKTKHRNCSIQ